jgi:guanosine-3',5'-bis(diphosphate) 3'-pyrophosphohydrolase
MNDVPALLKALRFAANKHRDHRRKDPAASPYINHPIDVADLIARLAPDADLATLQAAVLHDTLEDTETTTTELDGEFGVDVRVIVEEVTDDKSLAKQVRKDAQVEHAPGLSRRAKLVKIADKIANVRDVTHASPREWSRERREQYLAWAKSVVDGCRGVAPDLEQCFDESLAEGEALFASLA